MESESKVSGPALMSRHTVWEAFGFRVLCHTVQTQGSKDPNNRVLKPKYYAINFLWALKPYYLGPWTFRETCRFYVLGCGSGIKSGKKRMA